MRKVVIVNDACHVMKTVIPYLRNDFEVEHITRTRGLWDKTFGILLKIAKSRGDIYHINYALQDAYLASRIKRLDVLHVHGSDVRTNLNNKWRRIAEDNLKRAKVVLYVTPDLEGIIKEYRDDAIYFPNPVDMNMFSPKGDYTDKSRAVYWKNWYEEFPVELKSVLETFGIELTIYDEPIFSYEEMPTVLQGYDIYIDRFEIPSISKACLEAMSCGLATIDFRHMGDFGDRALVLSDIDHVIAEGKANIEYVKKKHEASLVAERLKKVYESLG